MYSIFACMVVGTVFGAGLAIATEQVPENKPPRYLAKFDEQFKSADQNGDGGLTRTEAEGAGMHRILDNFERLDVNRDGKVTREEIRALLRSRLSS